MIQAVLVRGEGRFNLFGTQGHINRTYGFVGVLYAFFAFEISAFSAERDKFFAVFLFNKFFGGFFGFVGNTHRVRTHIGNKGYCAFIFYVNAFIQSLGCVHGSFCRKAQTLVSRLLQGGSGKRSLRSFAAFFFFNTFHKKRGVLQSFFNGKRLLFVLDLYFFTVHFGKFCLERHTACSKPGFEIPKFFRNKGETFFFAFHDKTKGNRLYPSCGNAPFDGFP